MSARTFAKFGAKRYEVPGIDVVWECLLFYQGLDFFIIFQARFFFNLRLAFAHQEHVSPCLVISWRIRVTRSASMVALASPSLPSASSPANCDTTARNPHAVNCRRMSKLSLRRLSAFSAEAHPVCIVWNANGLARQPREWICDGLEVEAFALIGQGRVQ